MPKTKSSRSSVPTRRCEGIVYDPLCEAAERREGDAGHHGRGDVLFFNGNLIHGSYRNKTKDRFRRAFICHYANASAATINIHYNPLFKADGTEVVLEGNPDGGPCGVEVGEFTYH